MGDHQQKMVRVTVDFTGGLEMIFRNERVHDISIPAVGSDGQRAAVRDLIKHLTVNVRDDPRQEYFVLDDGETIRPGILVLINDADWELEGEETYQLEPGDRITFMSTLHGG